MYTLFDVYQSILEAVVRFWDNRFVIKNDEALTLLRLELDRAHHQIDVLQRSILEIAAPRPIVDEEPREFEPLPVGKPHWRVQAQKLEAESKKRRQELDAEFKASQSKMTVRGSELSVEDLEKELGVENAI